MTEPEGGSSAVSVESHNDPMKIKAEADRLRDSGQIEAALPLYNYAVKLRPQFAGAHYEVGQILIRQGKYIEAANAFWLAWLHGQFRKEPALMCGRSLSLASFWQEAVAVFERLAPADVDPDSALFFADALRGESRIRDALNVLDRAHPPDSANLRRIRGACYAEMGWPEKARPLLESTLGVDSKGFAIDRLIGIYYALEDYSALKAIVAHAMSVFPQNHYYTASKGVLDIVLDSRQPTEDARNGERADIVDAALYLAPSIASGARLTGSTYQTFDLLKPLVSSTGLLLEFGVRNGHSIHHLAEIFPSRKLYGFDSFVGLPEAWHDEGAGSYSAGGRLPKVPANVEFVVGWFSDTLPGFKQAHQEPIAFMNVDCDLYSATKTIFDELDAQIVPGTIIVFDEYIGNKTWRLDEFKAFQEWVQSKGVEYEYLTASFYTKQVSVRILSRRGGVRWQGETGDRPRIS